MNRQVLTDYFNHPMDTTRNNTMYVKLWCKGQVQKYVEENMNETNYKFFGEWFRATKCPLYSFKRDDWLTNDMWVYETLDPEMRKLVEYSKRNVKIIAKFCRMNYFEEYVRNNLKSVKNLYEVFNAVYDQSFDTHTPKKIFKEPVQ